MVIEDHETAVPSEPPKILYRRFLLIGFTPKEAANLVAHMEGLNIAVTTGWTIKEIETLLFLRHYFTTEKVKN